MIGFNWIDIILLVVVVFFIFDGWHVGFVHLAANFVAYAASVWFAIRFHAVVGSFVISKFGVSDTWGDVTGYIVLGLVCQLILSQVFSELFSKIAKRIVLSRWNNALGSVVAVINSLVVAAFVLLILLALPLRGTLKKDIRSSPTGKWLVQLVERYGGEVKSSLEETAAQAIQFLTVKPESTEVVALDVAPTAEELTIDGISERKLLELINVERVKVGSVPLSLDNALTDVARAHSKDMFMKRYFSHYDPQGHDAGYRLDTAGIGYNSAGENLAYAPDVTTAHGGLMDSEGHRKNILDPRFDSVGIGVIDAGIFGKMFTQVFTN